MVNILFHIDKFAFNGAIGGAEKVLISLANAMDKTKFSVTVQTVFPEIMADRLDKSVRYRYCYPKKNRLFYLIYRIEAQLGLTYTLHIKDEYDIEAAFLECDPTKVLAASTNRKAKKVAWVHCDFDVAVKDKEAYVKKTWPWYRKYDKVVCVSEKCRESYIKLFGNVPESVVLHNVINENEIYQRAQETLPDMPEKTKLTLLCVGRLTPQKNPLRLLRVHKRLLEAGIDHELWWVGDGEMRTQVEEEIEKLGVSSSVRLFGFQSNPYPFMREADLMVCSSNYEGYSTVITEALILGKPIVTTDCSGMRELLGDSEYGLITDNNDEKFYDALLSVSVNQDTELPRLTYAAQQRGAMLTMEKLVSKNEEFLMKLLEQPVEGYK